METTLGIRGKDFVMLAADSSHPHSIMLLKDDANKIHKISDSLMIAAVGDSGDTVQFVEYISKNILLYKMRNGYELGPKSAAHFTRKNLADYLRTRYAYQVFLLVAGYDLTDGPQLHFMDYLANSLPVEHGAQGYGGMFCGSIFDKYYHVDITQDQAYEIIRKCVREIQKRLIVSQPKFHVMVVDKDGIKRLVDVTSENLKE